MKPPIVTLASASARRSQLLAQIGIAHRIEPAAIDERVRPGEQPSAYVLRVAEEKARAAWSNDATLPVLAADTSVVLEQTIFGKPRDAADARRMLEALSGRTHTVLTAVAIATSAGIALKLSTSNVTVRTLSRAECEHYWQTGEPADKAGAYAIQGIGAQFIQRIEGTYSGVMGLPLFETVELLRERGVIP